MTATAYSIQRDNKTQEWYAIRWEGAIWGDALLTMEQVLFLKEHPIGLATLPTYIHHDMPGGHCAYRGWSKPTATYIPGGQTIIGDWFLTVDQEDEHPWHLSHIRPWETGVTLTFFSFHDAKEYAKTHSDGPAPTAEDIDLEDHLDWLSGGFSPQDLLNAILYDDESTRGPYLDAPKAMLRKRAESQTIDYMKEYLADPAHDLDPRADPHCNVCHGQGWTLEGEGDEVEPCACDRDLCQACGGSKERMQWQCEGMEMLPCDHCSGTGFEPEPPPAPPSARTPEDDGVPF